MSITTTETGQETKRYTTSRGERVNAYSDLCGDCSDGVAQITVFWTDDAEVGHLSEAERFAHVQRKATDQRLSCRENCGRVEVSA